MTDSSGSRGFLSRRLGCLTVAAVVLGLVSALALVSCGGQSEVSGDDYTIFVHRRSLFQGGGLDAQVGGTLATRDGCVLLEGGGDTAYPVVWPSGTSIASEDPLTLELPSGEKLAVGQKVIGGGGVVSSSSGSVKVDIPAECLPETDKVIVFNFNDDPSVVE